MKAVIYARYSSDSQRDESIDGQIRECKEYAERNGLKVLSTFSNIASCCDWSVSAAKAEAIPTVCVAISSDSAREPHRLTLSFIFILLLPGPGS